MEYVSRRLAEARERAIQAIVDFRRVSSVSRAAVHLLEDSLDSMATAGVTVTLCAAAHVPAFSSTVDLLVQAVPKLRKVALLDEGIEWSEDQIIYRHGGYDRLHAQTTLGEQALLDGLSAEEIATLATSIDRAVLQIGRTAHLGERSGALDPVHPARHGERKLASGVRLATLVAGMTVGEMALLKTYRSADVWADTRVDCLELPLDAYEHFRDSHPQASERNRPQSRGVAAGQLIVANRKIDALASYDPSARDNVQATFFARCGNIASRAASSISVLKVYLSFSASARCAAGRALISSTMALQVRELARARPARARRGSGATSPTPPCRRCRRRRPPCTSACPARSSRMPQWRCASKV